MVKSVISIILFLSCYTLAHSQNIGLHTTTPQAPVHLANSGQVNTPGGFVVIGNTDEAHMELDFNIIQSNYNATPLDLLLQPDGGRVGINTLDPDAQLHIKSSGSVNTPGGLVLLGSREEGHLELDFNIIQSRYGVGSFLDLSLQPSGGKVGVATSSPDALFHVASAGNTNTPGGLMVLGEGSASHMELDFDLIQARFNNLASVLRLNPDGGNVGIQTNNPISPLHIFSNGVPVTEGLLTLGHQGSVHLEFDADRLQAKSGGSSSPLLLQPDGGNANICNGDLFVDAVNNRVGINDATPSYGLEVNGTIGVSQFLIRRGDDDTYLNMLNNRQQVFAGGQKMLDLSNGALDSIAIGDGGQVDVDINDGIYVDGFDKQVAIGHDFTNPGARLHINGGNSEYAFQVSTNNTPSMYVRSHGQVVIPGHIPIEQLPLPFDSIQGGTMWIGGPEHYGLLFAGSNIQAIDHTAHEAEILLNADGGDVILSSVASSLGIHTLSPESDVHIYHFDPANGGGLMLENGGHKWLLGASSTGLRFYRNGVHISTIENDGDYADASDGRFKKDITYLTSVLDDVMKLKPATYHFVNHDQDDPLKYGFIAQEVQAIFPEIVEDHDGKLMVKYDMFGVLAIQSIKELKVENDQLRQQVGELEERLARIEAAMASR